MAHIYVGFHDQRSCNRILKPPGGGTSNIFGTDPIPDLVPQNSPRKEYKHGGGSMKQVLQTETVNEVKREEKHFENGEKIINEDPENNHQQAVSREVTLVCEEVPLSDNEIDTVTTVNNNGVVDETSTLSSKVENFHIEEKSSVNIEQVQTYSETDSSSNAETTKTGKTCVVELNGSFKGSSIGNILKQDEVENGDKRKVKGPNSRVPPGGYSSGLW